MEERWKDIENYEGLYQISDIGRVRSLEREVWNGRVYYLIQGRVLKFYLEKGNRYFTVGLWKDGKCITNRIHIIVGKHFIANPEGKPEINHKNGDKTDNRVENLEWVTAKENSQHAIKTGLNTQGISVIGINLETNKRIIFSSMSDAARYLRKNGYSKAGSGDISSCCSNKKGNYSAYGHKWEYQNK